MLHVHRNRSLIRAGPGAQDGHLDFHTAPELCVSFIIFNMFYRINITLEMSSTRFTMAALSVYMARARAWVHPPPPSPPPPLTPINNYLREVHQKAHNLAQWIQNVVKCKCTWSQYSQLGLFHQTFYFPRQTQQHNAMH